MNPIAY
jgi:hypothetical protein